MIVMKYAIPLVLALSAVSVAGPVSKDQVDLKQLSDQQLVARFGAELPNERLAAARELASRGEQVLPAVKKAINNADWRVRARLTG